MTTIQSHDACCLLLDVDTFALKLLLKTIQSCLYCFFFFFFRGSLQNTNCVVACSRRITCVETQYTLGLSSICGLNCVFLVNSVGQRPGTLVSPRALMRSYFSHKSTMECHCFVFRTEDCTTLTLVSSNQVQIALNFADCYAVVYV